MTSVVEFQLRERETRKKVERESMSQVMGQVIILPAVRFERLTAESEAPTPHQPSGAMRTRARKRAS